MTQTLLPQLEDIVLDLITQKMAVEAQLAEIQSKLDALQAVIPLFEESLSAGSNAGVKSRTAKEIPSDTQSSSTKASGTKASSTKKATAKPSASTSAKRTPKTASRRAKTKTAQRTTSKSKKVDGRTATWQKYTRENVAEQGMPDAVRLILSTQPEKNFKIAEVMSSLFKDDMPKTQYLKARNRVSNILSGGVRDGEWFKGDRGTYRLAEADN